MLIAFALSVVLVCGLSLLIGRSISNALASMVSAMTRLAGGDLKIAIPGLGRKDEIGEMAGAVEVFKNNMIEAERLRAERLEAEQRQAEQRKADMRELANAFEGAVGEIVDTVSSAATELEASANTLTKAAERSQKPGDHRRRGFRRSFHQCAIGILGQRGIDLLGQRDQPSGSGIVARRQ